MIASATAGRVTVGYWIAFALLEATAQITLKEAAVESVHALGMSNAFWMLLASPWFYVSIAADCGAFLIWMTILASCDLSFAVPLSASSYIAILAASQIFLHETIGVLQGIGITLIGAGIILLAHEDGRVDDNVREE